MTVYLTTKNFMIKVNRLSLWSGITLALVYKPEKRDLMDQKHALNGA